MSKAIKVDEVVYNNLDTLRGKGETFSQVVQDLLHARMIILSQLGEIEHLLRFREWQREENSQRVAGVFDALAPHRERILGELAAAPSKD